MVINLDNIAPVVFRQSTVLKRIFILVVMRGKLFFWLFLISLPFGFRHLIFQFTPGFYEYEAIFLYASDVLMVLFLIFTIKSTFSFMRFRPQRFFISLLYCFLFLAGLSIFFASYKLLALYNFIRLVLLVLTALAVAMLLKRGLVSLKNILAVLAGLAVFESLIAFLQFLIQKSLGLWFLGESVLGPGIPGVAKIVVAGGKILRAYGTFPHPNVLAAFLLLGLFGSYYLLFKNNIYEKRFSVKLAFVLMICLISLGLVLTFSRTAWFLGLFLTLIYILYIFISKIYRVRNFTIFDEVCRHHAICLLITLIIVFFFIISAMGWLIFPRAQISLAEPSVSQRLSYNELGWHLIKNNPWGVGLGNQVIFSIKNGLYQFFGMSQIWQWQPIHNIYLLIGSETGILGLIVFLILIAKLLINGVKSIFKNQSFDRFRIDPELSRTGQNSEIGHSLVVVGLMFLALLGFGLFDHFLWTLQPGRLMLWLVLGIILGVEGENICPRS